MATQYMTPSASQVATLGSFWLQGKLHGPCNFQPGSQAAMQPGSQAASSQAARQPGSQAAMQPEDISIQVALNRGQVAETVWTTDLTYDYVRINAEYRT